MSGQVEHITATWILLYTDPGSGFLIIQLISSAIIGAGFYFRKFFKSLFHSKADEPQKRI
jgi:hypothetical protein